MKSPSPLLSRTQTFLLFPIAFEYEKEHGIHLQSFFDNSLPEIGHPEVQAWGSDLVAEQERMHAEGSNDTSRTGIKLSNHVHNAHV
jgi:hypothetical protein